MWFRLSKNKNIQKTISNIVLIYLSTTILLVLALSFLYMQNQKEQIFNLHKQQIDMRAKIIIDTLETLDDNIVNEIAIYPRFDDMKSAIYDIDKNMIFSTFKEHFHIFYKPYIVTDNFVYFIYKVEPYYLGAAYLVIQKTKSYELKEKYFTLFFLIGLIIVVLILTSFLLAKILIKPLSNNIELLDKFIKDTTHELNTPLSAILNNIEMLNLTKMDNANRQKINRIKIGATTISTIYNDLSFLLLNNQANSNNQNINISAILYQRIEYFKFLSETKQIEFSVNITNNIFQKIDKLKLERLFDNLISNAIKYSNIKGTIEIVLENNTFIIKDYGIGMEQSDIKDIFIRYKRFNTSVGGFGIGYDIIHSIIKEYNISIDIQSQKQQGTKVTLRW